LTLNHYKRAHILSVFVYFLFQCSFYVGVLILYGTYSVCMDLSTLIKQRCL